MRASAAGLRLPVARRRRENRTVLTIDRRFTYTRRHPLRGTPGIVVLRLPSQGRDVALGYVRHRLLPHIERGSPRGALWVVEPHRLRTTATNADRPAGEHARGEQVHFVHGHLDPVLPDEDASLPLDGVDPEIAVEQGGKRTPPGGPAEHLCGR
jgi:hypothetical protein